MTGQPNLSSGQWELVDNALFMATLACLEQAREYVRDNMLPEAEVAREGAEEYSAVRSTIQTQRNLHEALRASVDRAKEARRNGN